MIITFTYNQFKTVVPSTFVLLYTVDSMGNVATTIRKSGMTANSETDTINILIDPPSETTFLTDYPNGCQRVQALNQ